MRVEIVDQADHETRAPAPAFPPEQNYFDLRENPREVERIAAARERLPLRNFLAAVNGADSILTTACATTKADLAADAPPDRVHEFASQTIIVFADPALNWERKNYSELGSALKELLERETGDALRAVLRISCCDFTLENRRGFCLGIRLAAHGESAQQAELRWGLGLARVQQALLFRSRALRQRPRE